MQCKILTVTLLAIVQEAATIPGGDLGRGGRVDGAGAGGAGGRVVALAPAPPPPPRRAPRALRARALAPTRPRGENAHRLASFSEVLGH